MPLAGCQPPQLASYLLAIVLPAISAGIPAQDPLATWNNEQVLAAIARDPRPDRNFYINDLRAHLLRNELARPRNRTPAQTIELKRQLADELLRAGMSIEAIREIDAIRDMLDGLDWSEAETLSAALDWLSATAYLRLGEQNNCLTNQHAQSCIFPITEQGVHLSREGSETAIDYLARILQKDPADLAARWLINLAYMTLGEYPHKVPQPWLIPPAAFAPDREFPKFTDVAGPLGVDHNGLAGGCVVDDLNGDGNLDIVATTWDPRSPLQLYLNEGDGSFDNATEKAGLAGQLGGLNLTHADYDNDGDNDLFIFRGAWLGTLGDSIGNHPNSLLENDGRGRFTDVTVRSGLRDLHPVHSGAWADFDLDGNLDLFLGNESSLDPDRPNTINAHRYQLFRNNGDGTFSDVAPAVGLDGIGFVKGVAWGDVDNDGLPDLYLSRLGQPNQLYRNEGPREGGWRFTDITTAAGVGEPLLSFPVWFWDYDNDGWEDLFVASYTSFFHSDVDLVAADYLGEASGRFSRLYRNRGDGTFEDATLAMNLNQVLLAMGANFGDLDNDGYLDLYIGTGQPALAALMPNRMFRNDRGRGYQDITAAGGFGHLQKGHGIAFADIDNDGDQDVYAVMGGAYSGDIYRNVLFQNPGNRNHWITLKLEGAVDTNRSAIGARIEITASSGGVERKIHRTVSAGGSFGSGPLRQTIGLGDADSVTSISITWPDKYRSVDRYQSPPLDRAVLIRQGRPDWTLLPLEVLRFEAHDHHSN